MKARKGIVAKLGEDCIHDDALLETKIEETFHEIDSDGSGFIDALELKTAMKLMGMNLNNNEVKQMIRDADQDGDFLIDIQEFKDVVKQQVEEYKLRSSSICFIL